jgi:hypothetical protein
MPVRQNLERPVKLIPFTGQLAGGRRRGALWVVHLKPQFAPRPLRLRVERAE